MLLPVATFADVTPYPAYPGAVASDSYKVTVNGQPVFVHKFHTFNQFNWMDYASFSMTGKVKVEVTLLVSERRIHTADIRPLAYGIKPEIKGNTITFELEPQLEPGLCELENVVLAPHLGSATIGTRTKMGMIAVDNLLAVCASQRPPNCVNPQVLG